MNKLLLPFLSMVISLSARANPKADYVKHVAENIKRIQNATASIKKGSKEICPGVVSEKRSDCVATYIKDLTITDSTQIPLTVTLITIGVVLDRQNRMSADEGKMALTENLISLIEKVQVKNFYLTKLPNDFETFRLQRDDEILLKNVKDNLLGKIEEMITKMPKTSLSAAKAQEFNQAIQRIKQSSWTYGK